MIDDPEFDFSAVMIVHRYYFPKEWNDRFEWIPPPPEHLALTGKSRWVDVTPDLVEAQSWVSKNLADRQATIYKLADAWVVNTTEDDDITLLSLRFGLGS